MRFVSFMFLGGLPDLQTDSGRAWKNWILYAAKNHASYLHKIMFVTHPIDINYKLTPGWKNLVKKTGLYIYVLTNPGEHLKTAWATRSLVDATILMINKSNHLSNGKIMKFILLDSTTCPLYNLKVIYNTVTRNNLNWLDSPLQNKCKDLRTVENIAYPSLACNVTRGQPNLCFSETDCSFWSQWCILDASSIQPILDAEIVKDTIDITCPNSSSVINRVVSKNAVVNQTLASFVDATHKKPCVLSDEMYFGMFIKRSKSVSMFLKSIYTIKFKDLLKTYEEIRPIKLKVNGIDSVINPYTGSLKQNIVQTIKAIKINTNTYNANIAAYGIPSNKSYKSNKFYINPLSINDQEIKNIFSVPSTYVDWSHFNPDPLNIYRSFQYQGHDINALIGMPVKSLIRYMSVHFSGANETFESLGMGKIPYWAHPMQYNVRTLTEYVNSYNIAEYFYKAGNQQDPMLRFIASIYYSILSKYTPRLLTFSNSSKFNFAVVQRGQNSKLSETAVGCPVTSWTLNGARQRGALFIRKCENSSFIHAYSKDLYNTKKYLYTNLL